MSHKPDGKSQGPIKNKVRFSIVFRMNLEFILELFSIFLLLDFLLFAAAAFSLTNYAEHTGEKAKSETVFLTSAELSPLRKTNEYTIQKNADEKPGLKIPLYIQNYIFGHTFAGSRYLFLPEAEGQSFIQRVEQSSYQIEFQQGGDTFLISIPIGQVLRYGKPVFWALLGLELLVLFGGIFSRARRIRTILLPIAELAQTARTLNAVESLPPEEMERLAGKINDINASRLDTRIPLDSTQDELKVLASSINGMLDRINESYRAQVRFVSDASHELRTPIAVIQGYANLLDRWGKNDPKAMQESIDAIKSETDSMKALVEQLLFLARGDNNTMKLQLEVFDLSEVVSGVFRETQMIDGGHVFSAKLSPAFIRADEALIKQLLRILTDNAIKYTPAGGSIRFTSREENGQARITVQDEGIGIPPEALPRIFDRFFRSEESRARATGGAGLGLSIAKWITERHGGHMEVLSREDIGTRIAVVLPTANVQGALSEGKESGKSSNEAPFRS